MLCQADGANFFPVGVAHSIVGGSAWESTAWGAVQMAAWVAVTTMPKE